MIWCMAIVFAGVSLSAIKLHTLTSLTYLLKQLLRSSRLFFTSLRLNYDWSWIEHSSTCVGAPVSCHMAHYLTK